VTWWLLTFARAGSARYLSHLDTARALQRTFARAAVPIAMSQGMRPKPRLSLPLPLPVGAAAREEIAVVEIAEGGPLPAAALRALRAAAPPGIAPGTITVVGERHPRPQPHEATYACLLGGDAGTILAAVERYSGADRAPYERISPKGRRELDLRVYVVGADAEPAGDGARLRFTIRHRPDGAARPQEFIDLIAGWAGVEPVMRGLERRRIAWQSMPPGQRSGDGRSVPS
jgi:radical SAM-linked protein